MDGSLPLTHLSTRCTSTTATLQTGYWPIAECSRKVRRKDYRTDPALTPVSAYGIAELSRAQPLLVSRREASWNGSSNCPAPGRQAVRSADRTFARSM